MLSAMKASASWGMTPRESIEAECANRGRGAVVAGCIELLNGRDVDDLLQFYISIGQAF